MNHPSDDELLLLAYAEVPEQTAAQVEAHVATCPICQAQLATLDRARVALDVALPPPARRRAMRLWIGAGLAAAAVLAALLLNTSGPSRNVRQGWSPTTTWSRTAGYVGGGKAMLEIDAQLTRLEKERYHGLWN